MSMPDRVFLEDFDLNFLSETPTLKQNYDLPNLDSPFENSCSSSSVLCHNNGNSSHSKRRRLAERIFENDKLLQQIKELKEHNKQLIDLQRTASEVAELFQKEQRERSEFERQVKELSQKCTELETKVDTTDLECEQLREELMVKALPIDASDMAIAFIQLVQRVTEENSSFKLRRREFNYMRKLKDFCKTNNITMPTPSSPLKSPKLKSIAKCPTTPTKTQLAITQSTQTDPLESCNKATQHKCLTIDQSTATVEEQNIATTKPTFNSIGVQSEFTPKQTRDQGTQHKNMTTTRSTTTASFIKKHDVGTSFPERCRVPSPNIEQILNEMIYWQNDKQPISPIQDLIVEEKRSPSTALSSVGTCTYLCNINRTIDFMPDIISPAFIKHSNSRPPSRAHLKDEENLRTDPDEYRNIARDFLNSLPQNRTCLDGLQPMVFNQLWQVFGKMVLGLLQHPTTTSTEISPHQNITKEDFIDWLNAFSSNRSEFDEPLVNITNNNNNNSDIITIGDSISSSTATTTTTTTTTNTEPTSDATNGGGLIRKRKSRKRKSKIKFKPIDESRKDLITPIVHLMPINIIEESPGIENDKEEEGAPPIKKSLSIDDSEEDHLATETTTTTTPPTHEETPTQQETAINFLSNLINCNETDSDNLYNDLNEEERFMLGLSSGSVQHRESQQSMIEDSKDKQENAKEFILESSEEVEEKEEEDHFHNQSILASECSSPESDNLVIDESPGSTPWEETTQQQQQQQEEQNENNDEVDDIEPKTITKPVVKKRKRQDSVSSTGSTRITRLRVKQMKLENQLNDESERNLDSASDKNCDKILIKSNSWLQPPSSPVRNPPYELPASPASLLSSRSDSCSDSLESNNSSDPKLTMNLSPASTSIIEPNLSCDELSPASPPIPESSTSTVSICDESPASPAPQDAKGDDAEVKLIPLDVPFEYCGKQKGILHHMLDVRRKMGKKSSIVTFNAKNKRSQDKETLKVMNIILKYLRDALDIQSAVSDLWAAIHKITHDEIKIIQAFIKAFAKVDCVKMNQFALDRFLDSQPDMLQSIMNELDEQMFQLKHKPPRALAIKYINLYIKLIELQTKYADPLSYKNPARLLLINILYFYQIDMEPLVLEVLKRYPTVLPHRDERTYQNDDPIITVIKHLLMNHKYDVQNPDGPERELLSMLRFVYHFQPFEPTRQQVLENFIAKLKAGKGGETCYAFSILCRCNTTINVVQDVLTQHLMPLAKNFWDLSSQSEEHDVHLIDIITCISMIVKQLPSNTDISSYLKLYKGILLTSTSSSRPHIQESAVQAILRLQRYGYKICIDALEDYKPDYDLSTQTQNMLLSFVERRNNYQRGHVK